MTRRVFTALDGKKYTWEDSEVFVRNFKRKAYSTREKYIKDGSSTIYKPGAFEKFASVRDNINDIISHQQYWNGIVFVIAYEEEKTNEFGEVCP